MVRLACDRQRIPQSLSKALAAIREGSGQQLAFTTVVSCEEPGLEVLMGSSLSTQEGYGRSNLLSGKGPTRPVWAEYPGVGKTARLSGWGLRYLRSLVKERWTCRGPLPRNGCDSWPALPQLQPYPWEVR